ncbi:MAG: SLBB domain-containing protein [Acidobacteria bacterium]|nr:SLBB domain-containing protein [Acidobacteriota bacterium]
MKIKSTPFLWMLAVLCCVAVTATVAMAQQPAPLDFQDVDLSVEEDNYVVGPQDVLIITSYDQPELTGRFTVETDGTFTYPLIGRVHAGGITLREIEADLKRRLIEEELFMRPQLAVAIGAYRSQRIFILGDVRQPGVYPLSGDMRLIEALALAGSILPTASGEVVVARASRSGQPQHTVRLSVRELEEGLPMPDLALRGGDTIFVLRAENVYVFGQVRNPGAYPLVQNTMVLQALSLAGGVTDRGAISRIEVVRNVDGRQQTIRVAPTDLVQPGDTIVVPQRFF